MRLDDGEAPIAADDVYRLILHVSDDRSLMPVDLYKEIALRLGVPAQSVERTLASVIDRIHLQVSSEGHAHVPGLGTFFANGGALSFEPDPLLRDVVNYRFTGLETVDVRMRSASEPDSEEPQSAYSFDAAEELDPREEAKPSQRSESLEEIESFEETESLEESPPGADERLAEEVEHLAEEVNHLAEEVEHLADEVGHLSAEDDGDKADIAEAEAPINWGGEDDDEADAREEEPWTEQGHEPHDPWSHDPDDEADSFSMGPFEAPEETQLEAESTSEGLLEEPQEPSIYRGGIEPFRDETEEEKFWYEPPDREQGDHPLGPPPEEPFEEADFSLLDEAGSADWVESGASDQAEESWDTSDSAEEGGPADPWSAVEEPSTLENDAPGYRADEGDMFTGISPPVEESSTVGPTEPLESPGVSDADGLYEEEAGSDDHHGLEKAPDRRPQLHERLRPYPPRTAKRQESEGGRRRGMIIALAAVLLLAMAAVAYLALREPATEPNPAVSRNVGPGVTGDTAAGDADAVAPAETTSAGAEPGAPSGAVTPIESTPLRSSEGIDPTHSGYTIIVHSDTQERTANQVAQGLQEQGFRSSVLQSIENGTTRYRVGVGQFETLDEATAARNELAGGALPDDAWVRRIR